MENDILKVNMFGDFSMIYKGEQVLKARKNATKAMRLLEILLFYGQEGISRQELLDSIYDKMEVADAANSLRVTSHRLKKMLNKTSLPEHNYIRIKKGIYYWDSPMQIEVDAAQFGQLLETAEKETDWEARISLYKQACKLYKGSFLNGIAEESWIVLQSIRFEKMYTQCAKRACEELIQKERYEEALEFCSQASKLYPLDEWQAYEMECYIGMNQYDQAKEVYESATKLFFEELGIAPPDSITDQFKRMSQFVDDQSYEVGNIVKNLHEDGENRGAYYCTISSFRDSYRLIRRIVERSGQSVFLMFCTLEDVESNMDVMSDALDRAIGKALRRGDTYTKYSESQYLILLTGTNRENCDIVFDRIDSEFTRYHKSWKKNLSVHVISAVDADIDALTSENAGEKLMW